MTEPNKIVIYESAMCCASGVCGPSPAQTLIGFQDTLDDITKLGTVVERFNITHDPKKFMENPQVIKLIQEQQLKALPITTLNGNAIKVGSYPTREEIYIQLDNIRVRSSRSTPLL
jgi:disulfide oxidoreductase YuzD